MNLFVPHMIDNVFALNMFQAFKYGIEKLRAVYYANATTVDAIRRANINLISDAWNNDSILKAVVLHTRANTHHPDLRQHKNTFLFRLDNSLKHKRNLNVKIELNVPF